MAEEGLGGEWSGGGGLQISNQSGEASLKSRRFGRDLREIDSRPCGYLSGEEPGTSHEEGACLVSGRGQRRALLEEGIEGALVGP